MNTQEVRIDKFLWAARIYKTRNIASEECRKGRILIGNVPVKPSRNVNAGEIIIVRKPPVNYRYKVIEPTDKRVSAKLVASLIEDLTPAEEKARMDIAKSTIIYREKGTGRPTKKDRRLIDRLREDLDD